MSKSLQLQFAEIDARGIAKLSALWASKAEQEGDCVNSYRLSILAKDSRELAENLKELVDKV